MQKTVNLLAEKCNIRITDYRPLSGGDINDVFLLQTSVDPLVVKINDPNHFPKMFECEAKGLQLLAESGSFRIPKVKETGTIDSVAFLLMEYIAPGNPDQLYWSQFATSLAQMHKNTARKFGLEHDNYIGSLPQSNGQEETASEFYLLQRLEPQFRLAANKGYSFNDLDLFFKKLEDLIPNEGPSLIHGDLWNGNYLTDSNGKPVLIDPAVAYGSRETDLAMMQLFGGFPDEVFSMYDEQYPLEMDWKERTPLWQLYFLLVHLNLFGAGYLGSVKNIIARFS